jgi:hypothetical protein
MTTIVIAKRRSIDAVEASLARERPAYLWQHLSLGAKAKKCQSGLSWEPTPESRIRSDRKFGPCFL